MIDLENNVKRSFTIVNVQNFSIYFSQAFVFKSPRRVPSLSLTRAVREFYKSFYLHVKIHNNVVSSIVGILALQCVRSIKRNCAFLIAAGCVIDRAPGVLRRPFAAPLGPTQIISVIVPAAP